MKNYLVLLLFSILLTTKTFSQKDSNDFKFSISTKIVNLSLPKIVELLDYYKNDQIELLTLEMLKIGEYRRETYPTSIYFKKYSSVDLSVIGDIEIGKKLDLDPTFPPKYVFFRIITSRDNLYNLIIELSNNNQFILRSSETVTEGVKKIYEFSNSTDSKSLRIETFDGDKNCRMTFRIY